MIDLINLTKRFDKNIAVNNVTASIPDGAICGLAGSNGSGKSTLLRMLSGVYEPDGGTILIDGKRSFENMEVRGKCYYISDYPFFSNNATVSKLKNYLSGIYPNWDEEYFRQLSAYFPIRHNAKIINMSKGMQRQAALLLAFSTKPKYLFLDEIFDGLDPVIRQTLKKLIVQNVTDNNMTAVIASHNLREFEDICDTMILLHNGNVVSNSKIEEMRSKAFKVQIAFSDDVTPDIFSGLNTRNILQNGRYFTLLISGDEESIRNRLAQLNPAFVEMLPLTLEEMFITEMGGAGYEVF